MSYNSKISHKGNTGVNVKNSQPFVFTTENLKKAKEIIAKYPRKQSAVMPLLWLVQEQNENWISKAAMDYVAEMLDMPSMHVYEVATFYTMYNKKPVGKYLIQICRTTPCWLCGSDKVTQVCKDMLGIDIGETTVDNKFTLMEVECLGACVDGPVVQINDDYYCNLDENKVKSIIEQLAEDGKVHNLDDTKTKSKGKAGVIKLSKSKKK